MKPGDTALVIGEGLVGLHAAQALRRRGVHVVVSGLQAFRLEYARRFAADEVFDASRGDLADYVREPFPKGADVVVETASSAATVRLEAGILRNAGHLMLNGFSPRRRTWWTGTGCGARISSCTAPIRGRETAIR